MIRFLRSGALAAVLALAVSAPAFADPHVAAHAPAAVPQGAVAPQQDPGDQPITVDPNHLRTAISLMNGAKANLVIDELGNISDHPNWTAVCESLAGAKETQRNWIPLALLRAIPNAAGHPCAAPATAAKK